MKNDIENFIDQNCIDCKEKCDKGIIEKEEFIRCVDKNITMNRSNKNVHNK